MKAIKMFVRHSEDVDKLHERLFCQSGTKDLLIITGLKDVFVLEAYPPPRSHTNSLSPPSSPPTHKPSTSILDRSAPLFFYFHS